MSLSNKDWGIKILRGNEGGEIHTAAHNILLSFFLFENLLQKYKYVCDSEERL